MLAGLRAYGRKLVLTGVATLVGTAFLSATLVVSDTLRANVERTVVGGAARLDVVVATTNRLVPLTDETLDGVRAVPGVRSAEGSVTGEVTVLGTDGRPLRDTPVGFSVTARTDVVAGRAPGSDGEVLLAEQTADRLGVGIGARVVLLDARSGRPVEYVVSGLAGVAGQGDLALRGGVGLTPAAASAATGSAGYSEIHVRGDDPAALRQNVAAVLGSGPFTAVTGRQYAEAQAAGSGLDPAVLATGLSAFALVALLVAGFVIQNTFRVLVSRRVHDLAIARCLGASRSQVLAAVLVEAVLVGVFASLFGSAAGVLAARTLLPLVTVSGAAIPADVVTVTGGFRGPLVRGRCPRHGGRRGPACRRRHPRAARRGPPSGRRSRGRLTAGPQDRRRARPGRDRRGVRRRRTGQRRPGCTRSCWSLWVAVCPSSVSSCSAR